MARISRERREIALQRVVAQRLAGPALPGAASVVEHMTALQGQDLRAVTEAVALRSGGVDLTAALAAGTVVRSWPMRSTLHLTSPEGLARILSVTAERQLAVDSSRRDALGIDEPMVERAADLARATIDGSGPVSRAELAEVWAELGVAGTPGRHYHLIYTLSLRSVLVQGPPHPDRAGEQLFTRFESIVPAVDVGDPEEELARWAAGYARSHGPVQAKDFARWTGLPLVRSRRALQSAEGIEEIEIDGVPHWRDPALPDLLSEHRTSAERLLLVPAFDELIIGYADRTVTLDAAFETSVVPGRNGVFKPVVVHRGRAVGTWLRSGGADSAVPFGEFTGAQKREITRALG